MRKTSTQRRVHIRGVGDQYDFIDESGQHLAVLSRYDGSCEMQHPAGPPTGIQLSAATTRSLAAALGGHVAIPPELIERWHHVVGGLTFDWTRLESDSPLVGRSIEALQIRKQTGVTVVAILRGSVPLVAPDPAERLAAGDELVVVGQAGDVEHFVEWAGTG